MSRRIAVRRAVAHVARPTLFGALLRRGLGLLSFEAIVNRDYPVVFANLFIFSLIGLVVHLITDLTYSWVDPRIDFESREA